MVKEITFFAEIPFLLVLLDICVKVVLIKCHLFAGALQYLLPMHMTKAEL